MAPTKQPNVILLQDSQSGCDLGTPDKWEPTGVPHSLNTHLGLWAIRECDLLHLMSVRIGAAYSSVADASERTGLPVRPVIPAPDHQDVSKLTEAVKALKQHLLLLDQSPRTMELIDAVDRNTQDFM